MHVIPHLDDEALMRRFLLGLASPHERERIERRVITDGDYFDAMCALEREMNLDHLRGRLPDEEKAVYRRAVLDAPARGRHVDALQGFTAALERARTSARARASPMSAVPAAEREIAATHSPVWSRARALLESAVGPIPGRWLAFAGGLAALVVAVATPMLWRIDAPRGENLTVAQPGGATAVPGPVRLVALALVPGGSRAELRQANWFRRPADAEQFVLTVTVPDVDVAGVGATLRSVGGGQVALPAEPEVTRTAGGIDVLVRVPAVLLPRGDYLLSLSPAVAGAPTEPFATRFFTLAD
jgi:hypothetical protein